MEPMELTKLIIPYSYVKLDRSFIFLAFEQQSSILLLKKF